jgi:hypothetical protein
MRPGLTRRSAPHRLVPTRSRQRWRLFCCRRDRDGSGGAPHDAEFNVNSLLTKRDAAARLGISRRTLERAGLPTVRIGRRVLYRPEDLARFISSCTKHNGLEGSDAPAI